MRQLIFALLGIFVFGVGASAALAEEEPAAGAGTPRSEVPSAEDVSRAADRLPPVIVRGETGSRAYAPTVPQAPPGRAARAANAAARTRTLTNDFVQPQTPLALDGGPQVPLNRTGSTDVLSPQRVYEATAIRMDEIANRLPGVSSRLYSGDDYLRPSVTVRGMPDNGFTEYTAVLVDGLNYSTLFYGWTALSIFPMTPERIWSAEVIRGAHAIRYGPNTIGGIVNFVTAPIPERPTLRTRLTYGSFNYHATTTQFGGMSETTGFGGLVTFVEKAGDTFRKNGDFAINELSAKTFWAIDSCTWVALNAFHWRDVHQLVGRLTTAELEQDRTQNPWPRNVDWHGWAYGADLTIHRDLPSDSWVEAQAYYRKARRALDSPRPSNGPPFTGIRSADSDNYNMGVEIRGESPISIGSVCNRIHWGARYHQEWIERYVYEEPIDQEGQGLGTVSQDALVRTHALSFYADDEIRWGRWTLDIGARLEWIPKSRGEDDITGNDREFDFFDVFPGASLSYRTSACTAIFANYHQSFRAPQTWSYDFTQKVQDVDFEHGQNAEIGFRWDDWKGLTGNLVAWYVDFSDFIDYDAFTDTYQNLGGYESYGADLVLDVNLGAWARPLCGWSVFGGVTRQESTFTTGPNDGKDTPHVPDWIFSGGARYEHRLGFYGTFEGNYWGGGYVTADNVETTPDYWVFDLRLGWRKQLCVQCLDLQMDFGVTAKNLFDIDYELQHRPGLWVPGPPRELFFDLSLGIDL